MNRRFMAHQQPDLQYPVTIGGGGAYEVTGVPYSVLVGADGKVIWEGGPGGFPEKEVVAKLKALKITPEMVEAKASKRLAYAKKFADDKFYARAEYELNQVVKLYGSSESAKKATETIKSFTDDAAIKAELDAQKEVAKIAKLGDSFERPAEKLKGKEIEALVKKLQKKSEDLRAKTPRAAKLADDWAAIYGNPWK